MRLEVTPLENKDCSACGGKGKAPNSEACDHCNGTGKEVAEISQAEFIRRAADRLRKIKSADNDEN